MTVTLAGTEDHPQARMVLSASLASGQPSHAYLFHGPAGTGSARSHGRSRRSCSPKGRTTRTPCARA